MPMRLPPGTSESMIVTVRLFLEKGGGHLEDCPWIAW